MDKNSHNNNIGQRPNLYILVSILSNLPQIFHNYLKWPLEFIYNILKSTFIINFKSFIFNVYIIIILSLILHNVLYIFKSIFFFIFLFYVVQYIMYLFNVINYIIKF